MRTVTHLVFAMLVVPVTGCAPDRTVEALPPPNQTNALSQIGELYRYLNHEKSPTPKRVEDIDTYVDQLSDALPLIKSGDIVVVWGAGYTKAGPGAQSVLAYGKNVPTEGGKVVLRNGTVKDITAEEFKAASKPNA